LNEPYWEVLNNAPTRPLDYTYLKALTPAAQRFYSMIKFFALDVPFEASGSCVDGSSSR
jgi:hypothetical protein